MNWVDVLGGLLVHDVIQEWRGQRQRAKAVAAGWIPPERLPWVAENAWQGTEDIMIDGYLAAQASAQAAPDQMAAANILIAWARDAVPRLMRLHRTFEDVIVSIGAGPGDMSYDLFQGGYLTIGTLWLPAAQRIANATGYGDVADGMQQWMQGRQSWAELQRRMGVQVGDVTPPPEPVVASPPPSEPEVYRATTQQRPTKACPACAETILLAARICRFCRYEFWAEGVSPPAQRW